MLERNVASSELIKLSSNMPLPAPAGAQSSVAAASPVPADRWLSEMTISEIPSGPLNGVSIAGDMYPYPSIGPLHLVLSEASARAVRIGLLFGLG
jgi:hypothetical protein